MKVDKPNQIPESNCKTVSFLVSTKMLKNADNVLLWTCFDIFLSFIAIHCIDPKNFKLTSSALFWVVLAFLSQEWGFRHLLLDGVSEVEEPVYFGGSRRRPDRAGRRQGGSAAYVWCNCIWCSSFWWISVWCNSKRQFWGENTFVANIEHFPVQFYLVQTLYVLYAFLAGFVPLAAVAGGNIIWKPFVAAQ